MIERLNGNSKNFGCHFFYQILTTNNFCTSVRYEYSSSNTLLNYFEQTENRKFSVLFPKKKLLKSEK